MTRLDVEDVTVRYGSATALDRLSLVAGSGEVVAVVGPSGSGKSTLLRAVAGLEPLAGGRIELDGVDLTGVPTHRRGLGLMFQDHALFSHLDVADNVAYGLRMQGLDRDRTRRRVDELLDLVGLTGFGHRAPNGLSGGEGQRVALARALAPAPRLLMLDEPLGSLDRALRAQLTSDLRWLLRELGQTAVHVTHDQAEAFAVADRVAVLVDGRLEAEGPPAELWADPGTAFTARFLGHANVWPIEVVNGEARVGHRAGPSLGPIGTPPDRADGERSGRWEPGSTAFALVPVTGLSLGDLPGRGHVRVEVEVEEVRFEEGRFRISGRLLDTAEPAGGPVAVQLVADDRPVVGERLMVVIDPARIRPLR